MGLFKKKKSFEKENVSNWTDKAYTVEKIVESLGQSFYNLSGVERVAVRSDLPVVG